jgi:hypothetical protein
MVRIRAKRIENFGTGNLFKSNHLEDWTGIHTRVEKRDRFGGYMRLQPERR